MAYSLLSAIALTLGLFFHLEPSTSSISRLNGEILPNTLYSVNVNAAELTNEQLEVGLSKNIDKSTKVDISFVNVSLNKMQDALIVNSKETLPLSQIIFHPTEGIVIDSVTIMSYKNSEVDLSLEFKNSFGTKHTTSVVESNVSTTPSSDLSHSFNSFTLTSNIVLSLESIKVDYRLINPSLIIYEEPDSFFIDDKVTFKILYRNFIDKNISVKITSFGLNDEISHARLDKFYFKENEKDFVFLDITFILLGATRLTFIITSETYNESASTNVLKTVKEKTLADYITLWANDFLYMKTYDKELNVGADGENKCKGKGGYYLLAKKELYKLNEAHNGIYNELITNSSLKKYKDRYEAWAKANNDSKPYDTSEIVPYLSNDKALTYDSTLIIGSGVLVLIAITFIIFINKKRKEI